MSAEFETGFSVRRPMWHGLGTVLDDYPEDWADARKKAGLLWEPEERVPWDLVPDSRFTACFVCGRGLGGQHDEGCLADGQVERTACIPPGAVVTPQGVFVPVDNHKVIARSDTGLWLSVRSSEYSTIYHGSTDVHGDVVHAADGRASMEEIIDAFRGADGKVRFETAGVLREGRSVWALLYLDEPYTVPGDTSETLPFLALLNDHSGAGGCRGIPTSVRVVCWNTWNAAERQADDKGVGFTFRHAGDVAARIDEAKDAIAGLRTAVSEHLELAEAMTRLNADDQALGEFISEFIPSPRENGEQCSDRVQANVDKARETFKRIYLDSVTCDGIRGTGWGLVQAGVEYLDHARAYRSRDSYLGRSILGREPIKERALAVARRVCK